MALALAHRPKSEPARPAPARPPRAAAGVPRFLQRKALTVEPETSPLEREAEAVAERVMRMGGACCASCATGGGCEDETLRRKPLAAAGEGPALSPAQEQRVRRLTAGGEPLAADLRAFFEPRLGDDLGAVRVHRDTEAGEAARELEAKAFTIGTHIAMGAGSWAPDSTAGRHLLAHELAHVGQQQAARADGQGARSDRVTRSPDAEHASETRMGFARRVHDLAASRLTRNIAVLGEWADYVRSMLHSQLQAQLLSGIVVERAAVAATGPAGEARFERYAGARGSAERRLFGSMLDIEALYPERANNLMGFLASKTQGYVTEPSVAEQLQVTAGQLSPEDLPPSVYVPPDPRYALYASTVRRFQAGEIGGCQTCHEINWAWQRTMELYGDPLPQYTPLGFPLEAPSLLAGVAPGGAPAAVDMEAMRRFIELSAPVPSPGTVPPAAARGTGPWLPSTPLPAAVEVPPPRTDLCGDMPPAEDVEGPRGLEALTAWGPASADVARALAEIGAVLTPLGPRGYRVLGRPEFDALYAASPERMEAVRESIIRLIGERRQDYERLRAEIRAGDVPYEELCPIVDELLPSTNAFVRHLAVSDVRAWQRRGTLLTVLELLLTGLTLMFPPAAVVTLPAGAALGLARVALGIEERRQGRQWTRGRGAGIYAMEQEAAAEGLAGQGRANIVSGLLQLGFSGFGMLRMLQQARGSAQMLQALEQGSVITHAQYPGLVLLARRGRLLMVTETGEVLGYGMIRDGQLWWRVLPQPFSPASAAGVPGTGTALVPYGPTALVPFEPVALAPIGASPFGAPLAVPAPGGLLGAPVATRGALMLTAPPGPLALGPGPPPPLMLPAPQYESFADLQPFVRELFGPGATAGVTWSVTPQGTAFVTPPVSGVAIYTPEGMLPPGQYFAGAGQPRVPVLAGTPREELSVFDVLPGNRPTTRTLPQVRGVRGSKPRGLAGEQHLAELGGGRREVTYQLPGDLTRRIDVTTPVLTGTVDQEVKNYLRYIGGGPAREVEPSAFLRSEITRDAMIPYYHPGHQPLWVFVDAPPSTALAAELREGGIPFVVMSDRLPFQ